MVWVLTPEAMEDLDYIAAEGASEFGSLQSTNYVLSFIDRFDMLAIHPYMVAAQEVDGLQLRLLPSGRHHILYVVENEDVVILRILHALQNWPDLI